MDEQQKRELLENMVANLPALRKVLGVSQGELAELLGVTRNTVAVVENRKRNLSLDMFLALILIFIKNVPTEKLLRPMGVYTEALDAFLAEPSARARDKKED